VTGYIRTDTSNNIADGNIVNAVDLDNEFNGVEAAFNASTGHTHDGTSAEGAPITKVGPTQDVVVSATAVLPKTDGTVDLGSGSLEFKDLYIDGTANIDSLVADTADINGGTADAVTIGGTTAAAGTFTNLTASGTVTIPDNAISGDKVEGGTINAVTINTLTSGTVDINGGAVDGTSVGASTPSTGAFTTLSTSGVNNLAGLTASTALALDASKNVVSVANTGTGSNVLNTSPTLVTPALGTPASGVMTNVTGTAAGLTAGNTTTNANLTGAVTSVGNAASLGSFTSAQLATALTDETGTGANVFATSPTLVTPALGTPSSGVVTNLTGTASININGTVGASTPSTGAFTTLSASGATTLSTLRVASILDASGGATTTINGFTPTVSNMAGRNRLINGDFRIDQRNAGASETANGVYTVDRWNFGAVVAGKLTYGQNYNSLTPPAGFTNYMGFKTTTAYTVGASEFFLFTQEIEGYNAADFDFGKSSAKTITISFWVNSSLTGTFGVVLANSAQNRSYPATYTISSSNTWEQKFITVVGDTTGTWLTTNGKGLSVFFGLGVGSTFNGTAGSWQAATYLGTTGATSVVGTLNATWNITGVQLEEGSVATPFERRPIGQELALCQRYYQTYGGNSGNERFGGGFNYLTTQSRIDMFLATTMRSVPTLTISSASHFSVEYGGGAIVCTAISLDQPSTKVVSLNCTVSSGLVQGQGVHLNASGTSNARLNLSAEL